MCNKNKQFLLLFWGFLFSNLALASSPQNKGYPFLLGGLNRTHYAQCQNFIRQCPLTPLLPSPSCINKVLNHYVVCLQLKKLSAELKIFASLLTASQIGNLTLLEVRFPADGQKQYYLISRQGYLINTLIDPRSLNGALAKKYKKTDFLILNRDEPGWQIYPDGSQSFNFLLRIADTCLACRTIGWATLYFKFSKTGELNCISLLNFRLETN